MVDDTQIRERAELSIPKNTIVRYAVDRLSTLSGDDSERDHQEADKILLECLERLGAWEVSREWRRAEKRIDFWYA